MSLEVAVSAPPAVAEAPEFTPEFTNAWLDRVEASVEKARALLLSPKRGDLLRFIYEMEWACRERERLAAKPEMAPRLESLRNRLTLVRSMLRQAAAFEQARIQLEAESFVGYTSKGLERTL